MINIIKSDLYRIFRGKAIYISVAIIIFMVVISCITMQPGHVGIAVNSNLDLNDTEMLSKISSAKSLTEFRDVMKSYGTFALDKQIIGANTNLYYFFIVIVVCALAIDFSNKSIKNTLSSAITRKKYYLSKLILILTLSTALIFINNGLTYILNLIINGNEFASPFIEIIKITAIQLPILYGIISLLVCFAFVFKKTSLFNTVSIPFIMLVQLIGLGIINIFKIKADWFYDYEIQYALAKLVDNPTNNYIISIAILGIIYIVLFNIIGYVSFKKSEIR